MTVGFAADAKKTAANNSPLILGHMYTVAGLVRNASGIITGIKLRNPWGTDGGAVKTDNIDDGFITVTLQQLWDVRSIGRVNWGRV